LRIGEVDDDNVGIDFADAGDQPVRPVEALPAREARLLPAVLDDEGFQLGLHQ
jgi:hypothetical protein